MSCVTLCCLSGLYFPPMWGADIAIASLCLFAFVSWRVSLDNLSWFLFAPPTDVTCSCLRDFAQSSPFAYKACSHSWLISTRVNFSSSVPLCVRASLSHLKTPSIIHQAYLFLLWHLSNGHDLRTITYSWVPLNAIHLPWHMSSTSKQFLCLAYCYTPSVLGSAWPMTHNNGCIVGLESIPNALCNVGVSELL